MSRHFNQTIHALILRRSGLGLLMGKFHQFLTELSACDMIMAGFYNFTFLFDKAVLRSTFMEKLEK